MRRNIFISPCCFLFLSVLCAALLERGKSLRGLFLCRKLIEEEKSNTWNCAVCACTNSTRCYLKNLGGMKPVGRIYTENTGTLIQVHISVCGQIRIRICGALRIIM